MYKCIEYNSRFLAILQFCAKYKIPWIVKWSYQIKDHILIKNFSVKWWDSYDRDRIINFVFKEFPVKVVKELEDKPLSSSIPDLLKGKSPEELAEICRLAAIQCESASASGKHSLASSEGSTNEAIKVFFLNFLILYQCPQTGIRIPCFRILKIHMRDMELKKLKILILTKGLMVKSILLKQQSVSYSR
jgi:hypothetical protein